MKTYRKRHQKILHHCLTRMNLTPEEFSVLTTLNENESSAWFGASRPSIRNFLNLLGNIVQYQKYKKMGNAQKLFKFRVSAEKHLYLWSDSIELQLPIESNCLQSLGLSLLSEYNQRQAIIFSIRVGARFSGSAVIVKAPHRLGALIEQAISKHSTLVEQMKKSELS